MKETTKRTITTCIDLFLSINDLFIQCKAKTKPVTSMVDGVDGLPKPPKVYSNVLCSAKSWESTSFHA